ncbi:hypothetical protein [uncultured Victivallis sp.]|uniref:hypothetical protein n=1 Tax=uncultured Victivallis sp. TaxID=354118 RepID=UPI0025916451|nr:hypothetical protein [uncultured Victivallis sp.]
MNELEKILLDKQLSLAAKGLAAMAAAMPTTWKYRWVELRSLCDCAEAEAARKELLKKGIEVGDVFRASARTRGITTNLNISEEYSLIEENKGSSRADARRRADACVRESYPETPAEVVAAAADRAYLMSLAEAANFIAFYGAAGWRMKDDRPIRNWVCLLDRWKVGQTPEQYRQAQEEQRRRQQGIAPDAADDMVTLESGELWPKSDAVYLDEYDVWVKASGAC